MTDIVELLDRERDHLRRLGAVDFLRRLPHYVELVRGQPELRQPLDEFEAAARQQQDAFGQKEEELIERTAATKRRFVELAPAADDSAAAEPDDFGGHEYSEWMFTLARFDRLAVQNFAVIYPKIPSDNVEKTPLGDLANILRGKIDSEQYPEPNDRRVNRRPDLDELAFELSNVLEEHRFAEQEFVNASKTLPGVALGRIQHFGILHPPPTMIDPNESLDERFHKLLLGTWSLELPVQQAVAGQHLDDYQQRRLDRTVEDLRTQVEVLHLALIQQLSTEELRRARQRWRRAGRWLSEKVAEALVAVVVSVVVGAALGLIGGYLLGQRNANDPAQPPPTTITTTVTTSAP